MNFFANLSLVGLLCLFLTGTLKAQSNFTNDYVIVSTAGQTNLADYTQALDNANWETYRLQNSRVTLSFQNGFTIELKSATELQAEGFQVNPSVYRESQPSGYLAPVLHLLPGNKIGVVVTNGPSKPH